MTHVVDADGRVANVIDTDQSGDGPKQYVRVSMDGGALGIAIGLIALGAVLAACILLPQLMRSQSEAAVAVALRPISAQVASAQDRAWLAERNEKINSEQIKLFAAELSAIKGQPVRLDGH